MEIDFREFHQSLINSSKNIIIFSPSYPSVRVIVPLLHELKKKEVNVEIIVSNNDLYKLYTRHYAHLYNYIINIAKHSNIVFVKRIWSIIIEKILLNKLKWQIHYYSNANILFFCLDFVSRDFYLIKFLKRQKDNQVYLVKIGVLAKVHPEDSLKGKIKTSILRLLYGKELLLVKWGNKVLTRIKDSFISDINVVDIYLKDVEELLGISCKRIPIDKDIKIVFFDSPIEYTLDFDAEETIIEKLNILEVINKYLNSKKELGIKFHPSHKATREMLKYGVEIQSYIPAELISIDKCKQVISIVSVSLAKNFLKNIPGICLINLFNWRNHDLKMQFKEQMRSINPDLYFPESVDEFDGIFKKILLSQL